MNKILNIKHLKNIVAAASLVIIFISGCKKYPDGPLISLHTKEHRIVGEWAVESFTINGIDSTSELENNPCNGYYTFSKQKDDAEFSYISYGYDGSDTSKYYSAFGKWSFADEKSDLAISISYTNRPWRNFRLAFFDEHHQRNGKYKG